MGPFGREGVEYRHIKGRYRGGLLLEESGAKVMRALAACGVLSSNQLLALSGLSRRALRVLPRLVEKGYLDCYESPSAPRLYALSEKGAGLLGVPYRVWDAGGLLRLAAANQFWLQARDALPGSEWDASGETPVLLRGGLRFLVLAPRAGLFERVLAVKQLNGAADRAFVVAVSEEAAYEIACGCPAGRPVRYTWDDELKDGFAVYRFEGGAFLADLVTAAAPKNFSKKSWGCT